MVTRQQIITAAIRHGISGTTQVANIEAFVKDIMDMSDNTTMPMLEKKAAHLRQQSKDVQLAGKVYRVDGKLAFVTVHGRVEWFEPNAQGGIQPNPGPQTNL